MQAYRQDPSSGCRLIGADIPSWSDRSSTKVPGAVVELLRRSFATGVTRHVLLVGPTAATLHTHLADHDAVDIVVRGLDDARYLASFSPLRQAFHVYCGAFDRFDTEQTYDLVICLDGPDRILAPDSTGLSHQEILDRLGALVRGGGTLMVAVANQLGLHNLLRLNVREVVDADAAWHRGATGLDPRALYLRELAPALEHASLTSLETYSVFPAPDEITLVVTDRALQDEGLARRVFVHAALTLGAYFARQPALMDPYALATQAFDSGMASDLAPAWLVVARGGGDEAEKRDEAGEGQGEVGTAPMPAAIVTEVDTAHAWHMSVVATRENDSWRVTHAHNAPGGFMAQRRLHREFDAAGQLDPPGGGLLEHTLREMCSLGNLARVRQLINEYVAWMRDESQWEGKAARRRLFALPSNVIVTPEGTMALFDTTWSWAQDVTPEFAVARGLRDFARKLLRSGREHPWAPDISPNALAQTLMHMADLEWSDADADALARIEAEIQAVLTNANPVQEAELLVRDYEGGRSQFTATQNAARGYRESLARTGAMSEELVSRAAQVHWLEAALRQRDVKLGETERTLAHVRGSTSFKVGRKITQPGRKVVQTGRRVAMSALPPGLMNKAERALRRIGA